MTPSTTTKQDDIPSQPQPRRQRRHWLPYWLLLPGILLNLAILYPFFTGVRWSFSRYDLTLGQPPELMGIGNYLAMFSRAGDGLLNTGMTFLYAGLAVSLEILIGFAVALMLQNKGVIFQIFRALIVLPLLLPPVVAAIMWKVMMTPNGVLNYLLSLIGLPAFGWLGSTQTAMFSVVLIDVWMYTPFVVLILLAGLQSVPEEVREAARMDGTTPLKELQSIILPLMAPFLTVVLLLRGVDALKSFDIIYTATQGGPVNATMTLHVQSYFTGIRHLNFGEGMAHLMVLWVICYGFAFLLLRLRRTAQQGDSA